MNILERFFYFTSGRPKHGNPIENLGGTWGIIIGEFVIALMLIHIGIETDYIWLELILSFVLLIIIYGIGWSMSMNRFCNYGNNGNEVTSEILNEYAIVTSKNSFIFILEIIISGTLIEMMFLFNNVIIGPIAIFIGWNIGWGVSIYLKK